MWCIKDEGISHRMASMDKVKTMKICAAVLMIAMVGVFSGSSAAGEGKEVYLQHLEAPDGVAGQGGKEAYLNHAAVAHAPAPDNGKKGDAPRKVVKSSAELFSQSFKTRKAAEVQERETALKKAMRLGHDPGGDLLGGAKAGK